MTKTKEFSLLIFFLIFSLGMIYYFAVAAEIKYPVPELGNCGSESECRIYCDKSDNILSCVDFGEKNGLISEKEAERAREFADVLKGEGPGGCDSRESCENYCENIDNINECLAFAEEHNFIEPDELNEAKKVAEILKKGDRLPGECRDKNSCKSYCAKPENADECLAFAEKAGFVSKEDAEKAKKALPFIARGESPGGCKTKEQCEAYCSADSHFEECISFAEKAGFMSEEEVKMIRKTGGKGPGGCNSRNSCESYCNKPENQEMCFKFAEEHGLIPEDKIKEMKEGMGRLRAGLGQAPPEVLECLKENLGTNIIEDIESGKLVPGPAIGERMKGCFEKFMPKMVEKMKSAMENAPPEILKCLKERIGSEELENIKSGEAPDIKGGDAMRKCFESMRVEGMEKFKEDFKTEGLNRVPPEIRNCIKSKIGVGVDGIEKENMENLIKECVKDFKPENFKPEEIPQEFKIPPIDQNNFAPKEEHGGMMPPQGFAPPIDVCAGFKLAPSCDFMPEEAKEMCRKCKGE